MLKRIEAAVRGDDRARVCSINDPNFHTLTLICRLVGMEASLALRRHFCSRTTQLITPLARYLNSLIPSPREVHRARQTIEHLSLSSASSSRFPSPNASTTSLQPPLTGVSLPGIGSSQSSLASPEIPSIPASTSKESFGSVLTPTNQESVSTKTTEPIGTRTAPGLRLKAFNNANFFSSLKTHGSTLPFKSTSKRTEFYERLDLLF